MFAATLLVPLTIKVASGRTVALMERVPGVIENPDPAAALSMLHDALIAVALSVAPLACSLLVLGAVLYSSIKGLVPHMLAAGSVPLSTLLSEIGGAVLTLVRSAALAGLVM